MRLPRILKIILNIYALGLAAILIWPVVQMVLASLTSDIVFPPRYFYFGAWKKVVWPSFWAPWATASSWLSGPPCCSLPFACQRPMPWSDGTFPVAP